VIPPRLVHDPGLIIVDLDAYPRVVDLADPFVS
jgi:hypothetical protein